MVRKKSCDLQKTIDAVEDFNSAIQPPIQALAEEVIWDVHPVLGIGAKAINFRFIRKKVENQSMAVIA
ncbi:MAG: hypothetical protein KKG47_03480 [Proteobacteria bacterium]|nr:hypothetical protein [Pseudomonadota bacterium]MBU1738375.1 hypothetical protein [Pseudomonadota bacterium]